MSWPAALLLTTLAGGGRASFYPPPARARPAPAAWHQRVEGVGQVRDVTAERLYLDRGAGAGLAVGQPLTLARGAQPVGRCVVEWVSKESATCRAVSGVRPGDHFRLPPPPTRKDAPRPPVLPEADEVARRRAVTEHAPWELVAFDATKSTLRDVASGVVSARLAHTSHLVTASRDAAFHHEEAAVRLDGVELLPGLRAWADVLVTRWTRPAEVQALQKDATQVHVRWAELSWERAGGLPFALSGGRTRPGLAAGLYAFDGLALRLGAPAAPHTFGVFLGTQPDPVTLVPSLARPLVGASWTGRLEGTALRLVLPSATVAWVSSPELGSRLEAQAALHAQGARWWDANALVRLGVGAVQAPGLLDEVRVDAAVRPRDGLRLMATAAYTGLDALALLPENRTPNAVHGQLSADWAPLPWLGVGAHGGLAAQLGSTLSRLWAQAQVGLPRLYGDKGGVWASVQLERGWLSGRTLALRSTWRPLEALQLWGRVSTTQDVAPLPEAPASQEAGLALGVDAPLARWLTLAGSLTSRIELPPMQKLQDRRAPAPAALNASLELRGRW